MLMSEIEPLKDTFEQKKRDIVQGMRNELNGSNVGGYLHKYGYIIDKIKVSNEYFPSKLQNLSGNIIVIMMERW